MTLYDSKSRPNTRSRSFGRGILTYVAPSKPVYSEEDARWWAQESGRTATHYDVLPSDSELDRIAADRHAEARYEAGYVC